VWEGQSLNVRYAVDEEGMAASPMVLVHEECAAAFDAEHPPAN
jgi:hypothetical protein